MYKWIKNSFINDRLDDMAISTYIAYAFWWKGDQKTALLLECTKNSWPCDAGNDDVTSTVDH